MVNKQEIDRLSLSDTITAKNVIFLDPRLLNYKIDRIPALVYDNLFVVVDDSSELFHEMNNRNISPAKILNNLKQLFGSEGKWLATSILVLDQLNAIPEFPKPYPKPWTFSTPISEFLQKSSKKT